MIPAAVNGIATLQSIPPLRTEVGQSWVAWVRH
jgi:hypothetical protein